jgi:hypothetical protein
MRAILHVLAVILLIAAVAWWWRAGSNKGWTKTSVQVWKYDEITGISYPETVKRFVPGVEIPASAALASALLAGAGFFLPKRRKA